MGPVYSLNVPVPGAVARVAAELHPALQPFGTVRDRHTLVLKRLEVDGSPGFDRAAKRVRRTLAGAPAVEARTAGIDSFEEPVAGPGPVVYLGVASPGLHDLHNRLVDELGAVTGLEGPSWVPHITLARGGDPTPTDLDRLRSHDPDPVTWTVGSLEFYDAHRNERAGTISLPA